MKTLLAVTTLATASFGLAAFSWTTSASHAALGGTPFELTGVARFVHLEGPEIAGKAPFKNTANLVKITECVKGNDPSCAGKVEVDAGGKAYLYFDSLTQWRIATNPNDMNTTTLIGQTDGLGGFQMSGKHVLSDTTFFLTGKVTFNKGTFIPKKVTGKIYAFSPMTEHYGTGNFSTKPLPI